MTALVGLLAAGMLLALGRWWLRPLWARPRERTWLVRIER